MTHKLNHLTEEQQLLREEVKGMVIGDRTITQGEFERIVLEYGIGHEQGQTIAFKGKEVFSYGNHTAYVGPKGKILIYSEYGRDGASYEVFHSISEASECEFNDELFYPPELLSGLKDSLGEEVFNTLDI